MKMFSSSKDLQDYVRENNVITWHGIYGIGSLTFIDSPTLHIVFENDKEYRIWDSSGRSLDGFQYSLF